MRNKILILFVVLFLIGLSNKIEAREYPYYTSMVDVSDNGRYAAGSRIDGKIMLFNLQEKEIVNVFALRGDGVNLLT